jgi:uncharacterized protein YukE
MGTDTVLSTPESIAAIQGMLSAIDGGLTEAITTFKNQGEIVNDPTKFEGTAAAGFRAEWPNVKSALDTAIQRLRELSDNVRAVNANIQTAGGN